MHDGHVVQFVLDDAQGNAKANKLQWYKKVFRCGRRLKLYSRILDLYSTIGIILGTKKKV